MTDTEQLIEILTSPKRKLIVSSDIISIENKDNKNLDNEINYAENNKIKNTIFILMVEEGGLAAGGRGGGSGVRRIDKITGFQISNKDCKKIYETEDYNNIEKFEIPYSAVAMDITLDKNRQIVVQGIVDTSLIDSYLQIINAKS